MSRIVIKIAKVPFEIKPSVESKWICMCGLSQNQPFCDKSHNKTADEEAGKIYEYDTQGVRHECKCRTEDGCCGECR